MIGSEPYRSYSFPLGGRLGRGYPGMKRTPVIIIEVSTFAD
jgi:hypothetical protein